ncbi:hypothetical protein AAG570_003850 [Ranatra chinensis]|uniref:Uncharacterized protein n=1 Tax=Ranatra chinensis TaxID=642074 RepID=A0ABD0Y226_9HEMI
MAIGRKRSGPRTQNKGRRATAITEGISAPHEMWDEKWFQDVDSGNSLCGDFSANLDTQSFERSSCALARTYSMPLKETPFRMFNDDSPDIPHPLRNNLFFRISERNVINRVSRIIDSTPDGQNDAGPSSLRRMLVRMIKEELVASGAKDDEACELVARKLAGFVERVVYETCDRTGQKLFPTREEFEQALGRDESESSGTSERELAVHDPVAEEDGRVVTVEEVLGEAPAAAGNVFQIREEDGSLVEVGQIREGDRERALVRKLRPKGKSLESGKWSTWMIDMTDRPRAWTEWVEEAVRKRERSADPQLLLKVSGEWKSRFDRAQESVAWRKRKVEQRCLEASRRTPSNESVWSGRDGSPQSRKPTSGHSSKSSSKRASPEKRNRVTRSYKHKDPTAMPVLRAPPVSRQKRSRMGK